MTKSLLGLLLLSFSVNPAFAAVLPFAGNVSCVQGLSNNLMSITAGERRTQHVAIGSSYFGNDKQSTELVWGDGRYARDGKMVDGYFVFTKKMVYFVPKAQGDAKNRNVAAFIIPNAENRRKEIYAIENHDRFVETFGKTAGSRLYTYMGLYSEIADPHTGAYGEIKRNDVTASEVVGSKEAGAAYANVVKTLVKEYADIYKNWKWVPSVKKFQLKSNEKLEPEDTEMGHLQLQILRKNPLDLVKFLEKQKAGIVKCESVKDPDLSAYYETIKKEIDATIASVKSQSGISGDTSGHDQHKPAHSGH